MGPSKAMTAALACIACAWLCGGCGGEQAPAAPGPTEPPAIEAPAPTPAAEAPKPTAAPKQAEPAPQPDAQPAADVGFMGEPERARLQYMREAAVTAIRKGKGGRSLGFKFTFEDGTHGYFKPEQSFSGANWYAEVATYYLDRALGMNRVPPVVARRFDWNRLKMSARGDKRVSEVTVDAHGTVRGALVHWLDKPLGRAKTPPGWESWVRVSRYPAQGVSPFRRPALYTAALDLSRARRKHGKPQDTYYKDVPSPMRNALPAELADMLVLDYLTHNIDRWGGDNTNLLTYGRNGPLVFLDNGAGFFQGPDRQGLMEDRMKVQQCFKRSTVDALEKLDVQALGKKMAQDPLGPFLDDKLLKGLEVRRKALLERVTMLMREHGEDAVLKW